MEPWICESMCLTYYNVRPCCVKIEAMKRGDVLVNDSIVSPDYVLKGGENLRSIGCHRHGKDPSAD
jgi:hypothetical protein